MAPSCLSRSAEIKARRTHPTSQRARASPIFFSSRAFSKTTTQVVAKDFAGRRLPARPAPAGAASLFACRLCVLHIHLFLWPSSPAEVLLFTVERTEAERSLTVHLALGGKHA